MAALHVALVSAAVFVVLVTADSSSTCKKNPIVIIPGIMGTQLEASLDHKHTDHWYCFKTYDEWYRLWLELDDIFLFTQQCFKENILLYFNSTTGQYSNKQGVDIRVKPPQFGGIENLETLNPHFSETAYFDKFVQYFEALGYTKNLDIVGAGYDWRLSPAELTALGYYSNLKLLIENVSKSSNDCPVTMVAHSMGGVISYHFLLSTVTQEWKDRYISQYITLGVPWAGTAKPVKGLISGDRDHIFELSKPLMLRDGERSFPSQYLLTPKVSSGVWSNETIVTTPTKNFSAFNMVELLSELKYDYATERYKGVMKSLVQGLPHPNVTTYCLYGSDIDTEQRYVYGEDFPNSQPTIEYGKGDGTVQLQSLESCRQWVGQQPYKVNIHPLNQTNHMGIVRANEVFQLIEKFIFNN